MGTFTALRAIIIQDCPCLSSLPKNLPTLETLVVRNCKSLDLGLGNRNGEKEDDIQGFGNLRILILSRLPKLEIFPKWLIQGPTSCCKQWDFSIKTKTKSCVPHGTKTRFFFEFIYQNPFMGIYMD